MSKKAKARSLVVRLISSAGTGFFYTTTRRRLLPKLQLRKFDPIGKCSDLLFLEQYVDFLGEYFPRIARGQNDREDFPVGLIFAFVCKHGIAFSSCLHILTNSSALFPVFLIPGPRAYRRTPGQCWRIILVNKHVLFTEGKK
ncbi:hypothetical protein DFJ73DRAFT_587375 [Zopfochytrium polystomum]|nr:hypothetical protein DFJ73DRAFT_587375 [Zopfochytrium polystomum]